MTNTINVHAQFSGAVAERIEQLIKQGYASNRTEAIRHAILECKHAEKPVSKAENEEEEVFRRVGEESLARAFDNQKDREAARWYKEEYKKGVYDDLPEEVVNELVHRGIASNKSEAVRLMILHYNEHFGIKKLDEYLKDRAVVKKVRFLEDEAKRGKRKTLSEKEALAKYKHLK